MLNYFALRYRTTAPKIYHFFCKIFKIFNLSKVKLNCPRKLISFLFPSGVSFTDTGDSQDARGREKTIFYSTLLLPPGDKDLGIYLFYSTLLLPPAHKHLGIYLQLYMWDEYHIFLMATLVFTRLLLDEFYDLTELLFNWLMMWHYFLFVCLMIWYYFLLHRLSPLHYKRTD